MVAGAGTVDGWLEVGRSLAWCALLGVAAYLVHAEAFKEGPPGGVRAFTDVVYRRVDDRVERLDIYLPPRAKAQAPASGYPAILAIHGGGWRGGTKNSYGRDIARLAKYGYVVISVDYMLSRPGQPSWPANLDDVRESLRWVRRHAGDYEVDPRRIAALGASAGGHLAALLGANAGGGGQAEVQAVVDLYGPTDLAALHQVPKAVESLELYFGKAPNEAPADYAAASPLFQIKSTSAPMLLIHGQADPLVPLSQSTGLADRLKACGVPARVIVVPDLGHSFGLKVEGRDLVPEILSFLDSVWSRGRGTSGASIQVAGKGGQ